MGPFTGTGVGLMTMAFTQQYRLAIHLVDGKHVSIPLSGNRSAPWARCRSRSGCCRGSAAEPRPVRDSTPVPSSGHPRPRGLTLPLSHHVAGPGHVQPNRPGGPFKGETAEGSQRPHQCVSINKGSKARQTAPSSHFQKEGRVQLNRRGGANGLGVNSMGAGGVS